MFTVKFHAEIPSPGTWQYLAIIAEGLQLAALFVTTPGNIEPWKAQLSCLLCPDPGIFDDFPAPAAARDYQDSEEGDGCLDTTGRT